MRFAIGMLVMLLAAVPAGAQQRTIEVDVPFDFSVEDQTFPAGSYKIYRNPAMPSAMLALKDAVSSRGIWVRGLSEGPRNDAKEPCFLVFRKYGESQNGERLFLAEVWHPHAAYTILKSRSEREFVSSRFLTTKSQPVHVIIMARAR